MGKSWERKVYNEDASRRQVSFSRTWLQEYVNGRLIFILLQSERLLLSPTRRGKEKEEEETGERRKRRKERKEMKS